MEFNHLSLSDWHNTSSGTFVKFIINKQKVLDDYDYARVGVGLYFIPKYGGLWSFELYSFLAEFNSCKPVIISNDVEDYKQEIDKFLIRIDKLLLIP